VKVSVAPASRRHFCLLTSKTKRAGETPFGVAQHEPALRTARGVFRARLTIALACAAMISAGCTHRTQTTQPPAPAPTQQAAPTPSSGAAAPGPSAPSGPPPAIERQPAVPGEYVEEGVASWYGDPFNGRRTSNGEIYDMHQFTAAHRTLPFGAIVRVTNTRNGKQTQVRITDRGPFVANRVIDLSLSAAQAIDMVGTGTAPVRLEIIGGPNPQAGFFGVQVGAFQSQDNAGRFRTQLAARYSDVSIATYDSPTGLFYRVRVGRLPSEAAAQQLAGQLRSAEQLTTFVVRLDD
jgi:rare lipoprotein A